MPTRTLVIADGNIDSVRIVSRDSGKRVTHFGRQGDYAGQFNHLHVIAVDSMGNVYTGEAGARRVQKFRVVERQRCK
jgi:hypothetical protein